MMHYLRDLKAYWSEFRAANAAVRKLTNGQPLSPEELALLPHGMRSHFARRHSEPALHLLRNGQYGQVIAPFLDRLQQLHVDVRRVTGLPPASSRESFLKWVGPRVVAPRDGSTIVEKNLPPIIVYVQQMHDNEEALLDTLFHESIHAVGRLVGRFEQQPENELDRTYWLEEITGIYGAQLLGKHFAIRDLPTHRAMQRVVATLMQCVGEREPVTNALDQAEQAVAFLLKGPMQSSQPAA